MMDATGLPRRPWFTTLASTMCNIPSVVDTRSVTLVSGGVEPSRLNNGGGHQNSKSGKTDGKLHNEWGGVGGRRESKTKERVVNLKRNKRLGKAKASRL